MDYHPLLKKIEENKCLKSLRLRVNEQVQISISQGLSRNCYLKVLDINWMHLSKELGECFKINTTIDTLKIRRCNWDHEIFESLCSCLSQNKGVKFLFISPFYRELLYHKYELESPQMKMELSLSKLVKTNTTIIDLFLEDLSFVGVKFIEALFSNKTIMSLHLRNCKLRHDERFHCLSEYVSSNKSLTILDISGNRNGDTDCLGKMLKHFANHPTLRKVDMNQTLDFDFYDNLKMERIIDNDLDNNGRLWIDCAIDANNMKVYLFDRHNEKIKNMYVASQL